MTTIGGVTVGTAGTGAYSGYVLADGDDFASLSLVTPATPAGDYFTTRGAYSSAGGLRSPLTGSQLQYQYDADPTHSGWNDANRGLPISWNGLGGVPPHSIVAGEGTSALRLLAGPMSTAEQALMNTGVSGQTNRSAMISSIGRIVWNGPSVIEFRARLPAGPAGQHPSLWCLSAQPSQCVTGNEYGWENSSTTVNAYEDDHPGSGITANGGTRNLGTTYRDGAFHTFTVVMTAAYWSYLVDGVEVNRIGSGINFSGSNASLGGVTPESHGNQSDYFILSNHIINSFGGENYSASAWAAATAGVAVDVEWWRVWRPTSGAHYAPLPATPSSDILVTAGQSFSVVLPDQVTTWGATGLSEWMQAVQFEVEEPGSSNTTGFNTTTGLPSGVTYVASTRTLSGTLSKAGRLHFTRFVTVDGTTCQPYRFSVTVAPVFVGSQAVLFVNGVAGSYDLAAAWDHGRTFVRGASTAVQARGLTVSNLPAGMTLGTDGRLNGTLTTNGIYTIGTTATNDAGQTSTSSVTITVKTSGGAVPAPTGLTTPGLTLVGSFDFDASTSVVTSGVITTAQGADGTTNNLTGTSTKGPTQDTQADGNGTTRTVAKFVSTIQQFLKNATNMGVAASDAVTMVLVTMPTTAGGSSAGVSEALIDLGQGGTANINSNHHVMLAQAAAGGFSFRRNGSTAQSTAQTNVAYVANTVHVLIGRSPAGNTAAPAYVDVNGTLSAVGTGGGTFSGLDTFVLGAMTENNVQTRFSDQKVFRVLLYKGFALAPDITRINNWAGLNYGAAPTPVSAAGAVIGAKGTIAGVARTKIAGAVATLQAKNTIAGSGTVSNVVVPAITGTGAITQAKGSVSAVGVLKDTGTLAVTQAKNIVAGVARATVAGTGTVVQAKNSVAGAGVLTDTGSIAIIQAKGSVSGVARTRLDGVAAILQQHQVVTGAGASKVVGHGALTNQQILAGQGGVANPNEVNGSGAIHQAPNVLAGVGASRVRGAGAIVQQPQVVDGEGAVVDVPVLDPIAGSGNILSSQIIAAIGTSTIVGAGAITNANAVHGFAGVAGRLQATPGYVVRLKTKRNWRTRT